jgi:hypothetical protein
MFPVQATIAHKPKRSPLPFIVLGGAAVAGIVIAIVVATKGGAAKGSAKALAENTVAAFSDGDPKALADLADIRHVWSAYVKCDDTAGSDARDTEKMYAILFEQMRDAHDKWKDFKFKVGSVPDIDGRDKSHDTVIGKGDKMGKGCVTTTEIRMVKLTVPVKETGPFEGEHAKTLAFHALEIDGSWTLMDAPKVGEAAIDTNASPTIAKLATVRDHVCACKDLACLQGTTQELTEWAQSQRTAKPSDAEIQAIAGLTNDITKCTQSLSSAPAAPTADDEEIPPDCARWKKDLDRLATCSQIPKDTLDEQKRAYDTAMSAAAGVHKAANRAQIATTCKAVADGMEKVGTQMCGW